MSESSLPDRRLLLVHAHPDDESINNGATMAKYVAEGAHVTLVTCTLGEQGEVLVDSLSHLAADRDDGLGRYRISELAAAMEVLGVTDCRFLGGPGRYRDTGMVYDDKGDATTPEQIRPDSFWAADLLEAADLLVSVIREVRPQVLVTYDERGGYGHPDHVQAHRVAMYASQLAGSPTYREDLGPGWEIAKIYWTATSEERTRASLRQFRELGNTTTFDGMDPDGPLPSMFIPDRLITTEIDGGPFVEQKLAAMKAHATQISVDGPFFAMSNNLAGEVWASETYRLAKGLPGGSGGPASGERRVPGERETDLFAGVA
jgi:N-acetyl-1-D-myo-inositol-2-amino-2-deoxy-alpha-D-glucopyranoside deacetylase